MLSIQEHDFTVQDEYNALRQRNAGAVVIFTGHVREFIDCDKHSTFYLQHYPAMTQKSLEKIIHTAKNRWPLNNVRVIHRVGKLNVEDQIVFVGVSAKHRTDAFNACEFIIDTLKTSAPFWKKEGDNWVQASEVDTLKSQQWLTD